MTVEKGDQEERVRELIVLNTLLSGADIALYAHHVCTLNTDAIIHTAVFDGLGSIPLDTHNNIIQLLVLPGISLTVEQWGKLKEAIPQIDEQLQNY